MTNATILGCGYVGKVVAKEWRSRNLKVTATTTTPSRVSELAAIAHHVEVLRGHDEAALHRLLSQQETLLVSIGAPAPDAYEATYDHTTKALAAVVPHLPSLTQIIYTSSYSVYGDRQGAWVTEESPGRSRSCGKRSASRYRGKSKSRSRRRCSKRCPPTLSVSSWKPSASRSLWFFGALPD